MNVNNVRKLIDALRSGQYKQGFKRLHQEDRFCALGVACDISGLGEWSPEDDSHICRYLTLAGTIDSVIPPFCVFDYYGFTQENIADIWSMNDSDKLSFEEIADRLEEWVTSPHQC